MKWTGGIAADLNGTGRKDYSVYYGFGKVGNNPALCFYPKGNGTRFEITMQGSYGWMNSGDFTYDVASGFNSIAAGDFNNDGKETIVFYDPAKGNLNLIEYKPGKRVSTYNIGADTTIAGFYGKTLNDIQGFSAGKEVYNTARVNLTADNVDGKDGDELIVTVSLGNLCGESGLTDRSSVLLVLKKNGDDWKIVYAKQMSSVVVSEKNNDHSHDGTNGWYMRSASSDVGDVDGDGALEIITVGTLADDRSHNDDDIRTDGTVAVITDCGGTYQTQTSGSGIRGDFLPRAAAGSDYVGYASDKYAQMGPVSLACVQFDGINTQEYIVVRGEIFYLSEGKFDVVNNPFTYMILNNVWGMYRPVVGNFDSTTQGREQIFWVQVRDKKETDLQIAGYYYSGNSSLKDNAGALRSCRYGVPGEK